eukprot:CAMPEP_0195130364 /NCGR_PEP_ID=MMETSP0448-20130528/143120_1 /TAXON_ID=66468 /ORGANISM="Heterocapsa triquestra, Strain CCMP 448" /LENGTH=57 /DNA_ID=CAMNT_0040168267 /DNA_START=1 /DNA_END=172 /DNA_ORIENTATION=+
MPLPPTLTVEGKNPARYHAVVMAAAWATAAAEEAPRATHLPPRPSPRWQGEGAASLL